MCDHVPALVIHGDADRTVRIATSRLRPARADLQATIAEGAAKQLRPKFMTVATMFVGWIPIMWSTAAGSDVVYPAIYEIWKWNFEMKRTRAEAQPAALAPCGFPTQPVSVDTLRVSAHTQQREIEPNSSPSSAPIWASAHHRAARTKLSVLLITPTLIFPVLYAFTNGCSSSALKKFRKRRT